MATFTEKELEYLRSQRLGRLATADLQGAPHVVPLGFRVAEDGAAVDVGGRSFAGSMKRLPIFATTGLEKSPASGEGGSPESVRICSPCSTAS
jgi:pyridoxamine 5'-phosphate oxidase-like protein